MARYRKIDTRIWNDAKFASLSDDAKLCFLLILTHPHLTSMGAMRATTGGLANELGWSAAKFGRAFATVCPALALHDERSAFLWLPNFLRYNHPESPNVVRAWGKSLDLLPECDLRHRAILTAGRVCKSLGKAFHEAFHEAFPKAYAEAFVEAFAKPMPNQEQEQLTDQDTQGSDQFGTGYAPRAGFAPPRSRQQWQHDEAERAKAIAARLDGGER